MTSNLLMKRIRSSPQIETIGKIILAAAAIIATYLADFFLIKKQNWQQVERDILVLILLCMIGQVTVTLLRKHTLNQALVDELYASFQLFSIKDIRKLDRELSRQLREERLFTLNEAAGTSDFLVIDRESFCLIPAKEITRVEQLSAGRTQGICISFGSEKKTFTLKNRKDTSAFISNVEKFYLAKKKS